jgi:hypothetical protein
MFDNSDRSMKNAVHGCVHTLKEEEEKCGRKWSWPI